MTFHWVISGAAASQEVKQVAGCSTRLWTVSRPGECNIITDNLLVVIDLETHFTPPPPQLHEQGRSYKTQAVHVMEWKSHNCTQNMFLAMNVWGLLSITGWVGIFPEHLRSSRDVCISKIKFEWLDVKPNAWSDCGRFVPSPRNLISLTFHPDGDILYFLLSF